MRRFTQQFAGALIGIALLAASHQAPAQQQPKRAISHIAGDLYRFTNNFHTSVFLVTPAGVIATDPINADAAAWLKAEIKKQFDKEIRYLIYSHDHADHSSGGEVFADTAIVIAHANAKEVIGGEKRPTALPDITFSEQMTVELGGKKVHLTYVGPSHSNNSIVMNFPDERTLFAVDIVSHQRLPFQNLGDSYFPGWIDALKKVESLDFDILAPGHGPMGTKADVTANHAYLKEMYEAIYAGLRAGKTLDDLKAGITMDAYKEWSQYKDWRTMNIEGIYNRIQMQRRGG
ncbi:MAG: MBL fold metallo-hydrolase [Rhodospirillales bacterium]|nr:MBL fold metallo-hydrolase [Rhodospirillales bacterium]